MPEVGSGFFRRAEFKVIHPHNDIEASQVWPFAESMGQITDCRVIVEEALVSEAQVDLRLDQAWVQGENLLEFFGRAEKIALSESCLAGAKRYFDVLL